VLFRSAGQCERAFQGLDGARVDGRTIRTDFAQSSHALNVFFRKSPAVSKPKAVASPSLAKAIQAAEAKMRGFAKPAVGTAAQAGNGGRLPVAGREQESKHAEAAALKSAVTSVVSRISAKLGKDATNR